MTSRVFDHIVIGVGGMGSAALYHLARRGRRVLGIERFSIPHSVGSSHGITRIIRLAYYEHPSYVPLLRRAYVLWAELEEATGRRLLYKTGSLDLGSTDGRVFGGSLESCRLHGLEHQVLSAEDIGRRWPAFRLPPEVGGVYQPDGGFLLSEECVVAHVEAALAHGAEVRGHERALEWTDTAEGGVRLTTDRGTYEASSLVVTAGAWAASLVPELAPWAVPERQVVGWFRPRRPELFDPGRFPVFILDVPEGHYYGFPAFQVPGFKIGRFHHLGETADPETLDRQPNRKDEEVLRLPLRRYIPEANGPVLSLQACMFTNSPDEHFIIGRHPRQEQVVIAAGFSGHGFKFSSVVGEVLADLTIRGATDHDIGMFRIDRFEASDRPR